ncbi:MAG: PEP-CTERM sorting domain-containing protein [Planctomycetota bacterium]
MYFKPAFAAASILALALPASADLYRITGDFIETDFVFDNFTIVDEFIVGKVGEFELIIDDTDILTVVNNPGNETAQTTTTAALINEPWIGYSITSIMVRFNGITLSNLADVGQESVFDATGPDSAQFYVEGGSLADLASGALQAEGNIAFNLFADEDPFAFVTVGNTTSSGDPSQGGPFNAIINEFNLDDGAGFVSSGANRIPGGGVQNVAVTLIPEPSSLALLGLGGLLVARRCREAITA